MLGDEEDINIWSSRFIQCADVCLLPVDILFLEEITFWQYKILLIKLSKPLVDSESTFNNVMTVFF